MTVVGKCIFDSNIDFFIPLSLGDMEYCFTNDNNTKRTNGYKIGLKPMTFFNRVKYKFCSEVKSIDCVWYNIFFTENIVY